MLNKLNEWYTVQRTIFRAKAFVVVTDKEAIMLGRFDEIPQALALDALKEIELGIKKVRKDLEVGSNLSKKGSSK